MLPATEAQNGQVSETLRIVPAGPCSTVERIPADVWHVARARLQTALRNGAVLACVLVLTLSTSAPAENVRVEDVDNPALQAGEHQQPCTLVYTC